MNLAIVHYHLNRGGVTQVIANQLRGLDRLVGSGDIERVAILYGGRHEGWPADLPSDLAALRVTLHPVPELDYDDGSAADPGRLAGRLEAVLAGRGLGADHTILHVHNHSLGKNVSLPGAMGILAGQGYGLLLQIHDFAEDYRPAVYCRLNDALVQSDANRLGAELYPVGSRIHYAVLNSRDEGLLHRAGMAGSRVHLLPNAASRPGSLADRTAARIKLENQFRVPANRPLLLYPVRAIARKNIGEVLVWSVIFADQAHFAITLAPLNPAERSLYKHWRKLATQLGLNVVFDTGGDGGLSFSESLAAADKIMTTSLAEGFGMVFLEAWLAGKTLVGRNLPEITRDFSRASMRFPALYETLSIPVDWVGRDTFCQTISTAYRRVLASYRRPQPDDRSLQEHCECLIDGDFVDFGVLDKTLQSRIVRRLYGSAESRRQLLDANPALQKAMVRDVDKALVRHNAEVVENSYSLDSAATDLIDVYRRIAAEKTALAAPKAVEPDVILEFFLELSRFRPMRCQ